MNVRRCMALLLLVGLAIGAPGGDLRVRAGPMLDKTAQTDSGPQGAVLDDAIQNPGWWAAAQEAVRQSEYHVTWQDETHLPDLSAAYQAPNRAHNLRTYFVTDSRSAGIRVLPRTGDAPAWEWGLSLVGYGYAKDLQAVGGADLVPKDNRIEYRRSTASGAALPLVEWYVNDERGLEQGFTLTASPLAQSTDPVSEIVLELALFGNLIPGLVEGAAIEFATPGGVRVLRYSDLYAYDATGRSLPALLSLVEHLDAPYASCPASQASRLTSHVRISLDTAHAVYPITIDPLASSPSWAAEGNQAGALFGWSVGTAGDVDGDGYDDLFIGAPDYDGGQTDEGRVYVYHGSASGLRTTASWITEGGPAYTVFGSWVSTAGDVNGDGYDDLAVGANGYDGGLEDEGRVYVYHGSASGLRQTASWTAEGNQANAYFGYRVGTAGDVNGDGYDDLVASTPFYDGGQADEGGAWVYYGSSSGLQSTAAWTAESDQADAHYGHSSGRAGDVNGDGYDDLVVGAQRYDNGQENEGRAWVYYGSSSGLRQTASWIAESNQVGGLLGRSVGTAGDVNGDGYDDLVVGAPYYDGELDDEGRVYVYHGAASGLGQAPSWTAEGNQTRAHYGWSVGTAGDVDGDGYADLFVGAPDYDGGQGDEGRTYVYYGSSSGLRSSGAWTAESDQAGAHFGRSVSTAGDVDGDGYDDLVVGAPYYDGGQTDEGRAFVYLGAIETLPLVGFDSTTTYVDEGASTTRIEITLDRPSSSTVHISCQSSDGSAHAPDDYAPVHVTLTFLPGTTTQAVHVQIVDDARDEQNETFQLTLSSPVNATLDGARNPVTVVILDNDQPMVGFGDTMVYVDEGAGTAAVEISLDAPSSRTVQVNCQTSNGAAHAPGDYTAIDTVVSFSPGVARRTVNVQINDDAQVEDDETFQLTLSNPVNATLDSVRNPATLTILDDDGPRVAHLPAVWTRWSGGYAHPCDERNHYCEDNDSHQVAYGPVGPGWPYFAYPDDQYDYYYFVLDDPQTVTIKLVDYQVHGDLILYRRTATGGKESVKNWGRGGSEMEIPSWNLQAGTYYVLVHADREKSSTDLYRLVVIY